MIPAQFDLAEIFGNVAEALQPHRTMLNTADVINGNHGDHMVEIFELAARTAGVEMAGGLADSMDEAGRLLLGLHDNDSARVYAAGLQQLAGEFRRNDIELEDLVPYIYGVLRERGTTDENACRPDGVKTKSTLVLKALVGGLTGWKRALNPESPSSSRLDLGSLFDLGIAYMQAKQKGGSRIEILSEAAITVSPLSEPDYRSQSGRLAIQALLQAISDQATQN